MQLKLLQPGDRFYRLDNPAHELILIEPIEDKWGNLFIAVQLDGNPIDQSQLPPETEVNKLYPPPAQD